MRMTAIPSSSFTQHSVKDCHQSCVEITHFACVAPQQSDKHTIVYRPQNSLTKHWLGAASRIRVNAAAPCTSVIVAP
jgi:hypothetical protein